MEAVHISFDTPLRVVLEDPALPPYRAILTVETNGLTHIGENMSSTMQAGSFATVSVEWKDKGGRPVKVDGPTKWESSDPATVECTVAAGNPQIANLHSLGPIGKVQIHATADADLGEGQRAVTASYDVEVIAGEAMSGEIKFTQDPSQAVPAKAQGGRR